MEFKLSLAANKTQGKEDSISYEFSIIFEILVHSGTPHMVCISNHMSCMASCKQDYQYGFPYLKVIKQTKQNKNNMPILLDIRLLYINQSLSNL
jgi:hypothetical protein